MLNHSNVNWFIERENNILGAKKMRIAIKEEEEVGDEKER